MALVLILLAAPMVASADTTPPTGTPATVSADPLPTAQIDGIVWKQAIYGNTVYATGRFSTARPAGVAKGGAGTVTRENLVAYDLTTGALDTTFVHSLSNGEGRALAVSPDGTRLYIGGNFTSVDGQAHNHFAAIDLTTNRLVSGFTGTDTPVVSIAATNAMVYVGGNFSTAAGQPRSKLAAYNSDGTVNTGWIANVTGTNVAALTTTQTQGNLVVGGSFTNINGAPYYSLGAVKLATGQNVPWASQSSSFPIRMQPPPGGDPSALGITSLSADATKVYLSAFTYVGGLRPGSFEGRAAVSAADGTLIWANDCAGDTYDAHPVGQVLYSVSHAHNCSPISGFPQIDPPMHALADTSDATGINGPGIGGNYPNFQGIPRSTMLNWFPLLNIGTVSGSYQAAWSVVGNADYIALGGEFTTANNTAQQGLVRYAVKALAPNRLGPSPYSGQFNNAGYAVMAYPAGSSGLSPLRVYTTSDRDNGPLTYYLYRKGGTTLLASRTVDSRFWRADSWTFSDSGITPGQSALYRLVVKDALGNTLNVSDPTIVNDTDPRMVYSTNGTTVDWTNSQSRGDTLPDFARGIHYTKRNGAYYTLKFTGTSVKLIGETNTGRGDMSITIDGGAAVSVSAYSATTLFQQTTYVKAGLASGPHTIKVTKASGTYLDIDGIVVR